MQSSDYEVLATVGRGSYGCVTKVRRRSDGKILARKEIYINALKHDRELKQIYEEIRNMESCDNPNIVKYYDREFDKDSMMLYIYMDYCENKDLCDWINKHIQDKSYFDESTVWTILTQMASALYACHNGSNPPSLLEDPLAHELQLQKSGAALKSKILHRDLKPSNILLDANFNVKLGDFGLSKGLSKSTNFLTQTYAGTPFYMSPEIIKGQRYSIKSDIWGLGCAVYEVCMLKPPFQANSHAVLQRKIEACDFAPISRRYSDKLRSIIQSCLSLKPENRPTAGKILANENVVYTRFRLELAEKSREIAKARDEIQQSFKEFELKNAELSKREQALVEREEVLNKKETVLLERYDFLKKSPSKNTFQPLETMEPRWDSFSQSNREKTDNSTRMKFSNYYFNTDINMSAAPKTMFSKTDPVNENSLKENGRLINSDQEILQYDLARSNERSYDCLERPKTKRDPFATNITNLRSKTSDGLHSHALPTKLAPMRKPYALKPNRTSPKFKRIKDMDYWLEEAETSSPLIRKFANVFK